MSGAVFYRYYEWIRKDTTVLKNISFTLKNLKEIVNEVSCNW
jgi:hypothetical protein